MVTLSPSGMLPTSAWKIQPKNLNSQKKIPVVISLFLPCNKCDREEEAKKVTTKGAEKEDMNPLGQANPHRLVQSKPVSCFTNCNIILH